MKGIEAGDTILITTDVTVGALSMMGGSMTVTAKYFAQRGDVNILVWGTHWDALVVYRTVLEPIFKDLEYGKQVVFYGYIPGQETAVAKLADDIPGLLTVDYFGTPTEDLPIMNGITNAADIDMIFTFDTWGARGYYVGHWFERYGTKICAATSGAAIATIETQFSTGQLVGAAIDARGGAELELLFHMPGRASVTTDTLSLTHSFVLLLLVIGNIQYLRKRAEET